MGIKAGIWLRVSTAGQDEASQRPDCLAYCQSRGYEIVTDYVVHGESAFHGEQDPYWSRVVADIESGVIDRVVIWKVDRLDRRNLLVAIPMVNRALDVGGSVEFATQTFIDLTTMQGRIAFAMFCEMAHQESQVKSDRIKAKLPEFRANGALWGRPPWGYVVTGSRYAKSIAPTDECREIAPIMFAMIRDGNSLREVAEWLDAQGVRPRGVQAKDGDGRKLWTLDGEPVMAYGQWNEGSVRQIIGNMTYAGRRLDGQRSDKDRKTWLRCEPVVDMALWEAANAAFKNRGKLWRAGRKAKEPALLSKLVCGNPDCDATGSHPSPMYRHPARAGDVYRCTGRGPQRRGCGNNVPVDELERMVTMRMMLSELDDYTETTVQAANDHSAEVAELRADRQELDQDADDFMARYQELTARIKALQTAEVEPAKVVRQPVMVEVDGVMEPMSIGDHFAGKDAAGRRAYLADHYIIAAQLDGHRQIVLGLDRKA